VTKNILNPVLYLKVGLTYTSTQNHLIH